VPLYRILWYSESDAAEWRLRPYAGDSTTYSIHFDDAATTHVKLSGFLRRSRLVSLLVQIYKEINAPFGELSENTLKVSTFAITSDSAGDLTYTALENVISSWTAERDALTSEIKSMLEAAEFNGQPIDEDQATRIIREGQDLLGRADACANHLDKCTSY